MATPGPTAPPPAPAAHARLFLIVNNVQKVKNIKNMLVSASAFGASEVFVVGQRKFEFAAHESFLRALCVPVTRVSSLADCRALCVERGIRIAGVEIMDSARSILDAPFVGDTAFIMGNEVRWCMCVSDNESMEAPNGCVLGRSRQGSGMNAAQVAICDDFVIIPQYGGGTASLNVTVAASIVMHSFAVWAKIPLAPALSAAASAE